MDPYREISKVFDVLSVTAAAAVAKVFSDWLASANLPSSTVFFLSVGAVPIAYQLVSIILKATFDLFRPLRRIFLWNRFVEGTWIEIATINKEFLSIAIKHIDANGYSLKIHGMDYNLDGSINCDFFSSEDMVHVEWPVIRYVTNINWHDTRGKVDGVTHMHFASRGFRPPKSYAGRYLDVGSGTYLGIEGWLLSKRDLAKVNEPQLLPELLTGWVKAKGITVATHGQLTS